MELLVKGLRSGANEYLGIGYEHPYCLLLWSESHVELSHRVISPGTGKAMLP